MSTPPEQDDLKSLIEASAREELPLPEDVGQSPDERPAGASSRRLSHTGVIVAAWALLAVVALGIYVVPLTPETGIGSRSIEARVGIAMYHVVHRIETYRAVTGHLPEFLDASWGELDRFYVGSDAVEYVRDGENYRVIGRAGQLRLEVTSGDDPEPLLHNASRFAVVSP